MNLGELYDEEKELLTQTKGYETVSERYKVIPTIEVIEQMTKYGFEVRSITPGGSRTRRGYQKHMVRMSSTEKIFGGEIEPQVVIHNSYDGTKSLQIHIGMFRFVCSNGLISGKNVIEPTRILHSDSNWHEKLNEFIDTYEVKYERQKRFIEMLKDRPMGLDEAYYIATKAYKLRHRDERISMDLVDPLELLVAKRKEDRGNYSWQRYNVLEESLRNGYFHKYSNDGSIKKAKILTDINEIWRFEQDLSDLFQKEVLGVEEISTRKQLTLF